MSFYEPMAFGLDEDWVIALTAKDPTGASLTLTGATVTLTVSVRGGAQVFATSDFDVSGSDASTGQFVIKPADRTSADPDFAERVYAYKISVTTSGGDIYQQNAGSLTLYA